tara:strand:- start:537 stop:1361 length:825 start_codon:yes stop_codon:yes gene_type:complete
MKTIYYYQTPTCLNSILENSQDIDVMIVSSIHFGVFKNEPYIHLNDNHPQSPVFDKVWEDLQKLYYNGVTIMCMVGGAGGAYKNLFSDYETYYPLLRDFLKSKNLITGIDLDVEENVDIKDLTKLIKDLVSDFGEDFTITMAPVADSLVNNSPSGFSSINYKDLFDSEIGEYISWFNVQAYGCFNLNTFEKIIKNGFPPEKIVLGMISGDFSDENFQNALNIIKNIVQKYPNINGFDVWELCTAPPDYNNPSKWATLIKNINYSLRPYLGIWGP